MGWIDERFIYSSNEGIAARKLGSVGGNDPSSQNFADMYDSLSQKW
jgi:hypothetical protein